jgi:hypothetical protein
VIERKNIIIYFLKKIKFSKNNIALIIIQENRKIIIMIELIKKKKEMTEQLLEH